jgi:hypothetical protein
LDMTDTFARRHSKLDSPMIAELTSCWRHVPETCRFLQGQLFEFSWNSFFLSSWCR